MACAVSGAGCLAFHSGPLPNAPTNASYADVDGVHVRYVEMGEGPPVILIHGFAAALETWQQVLPTLSKTHRVIALDLKGFGWTSRPPGDYSPAAQAKLVFDLMTQRGIERAAIVAHSYGSSVALEMALAQPERVSRLALYSSWVYEEQLPSIVTWSRINGVGEVLFGWFYQQRTDERIAAAYYDKERYVTEELYELVERALQRPGTAAAALAVSRSERYAEVQGRYRTIKQSTLIQWGREDAITFVEYGERLSRDLPNARLIVYPKCGHFPMIEAAGPSTEQLVKHLAEETP